MGDDNGSTGENGQDGGGSAGDTQQTDSGKTDAADYDYVQHDDNTSDMEERSGD